LKIKNGYFYFIRCLKGNLFCICIIFDPAIAVKIRNEVDRDGKGEEKTKVIKER